MRRRHDLPSAELAEYKDTVGNGENGQVENSPPITAGVHTPPSLLPTARYGTLRYCRKQSRYDLPSAALEECTETEVNGENGQVENSPPDTAGNHAPSSLLSPSVRYGAIRYYRKRTRHDLPLAELVEYRGGNGENDQVENSSPITAGVHTPPSLLPTGVRLG
ncbi:uncharacterized protein LOC119082888 isoform X2 [Bradysia coprophila]|nr:uncharacterized protein LOC119082888 isoform X2 [Bradysia coprophila]